MVTGYPAIRTVAASLISPLVVLFTCSAHCDVTYSHYRNFVQGWPRDFPDIFLEQWWHRGRYGEEEW